VKLVASMERRNPASGLQSSEWLEWYIENLGRQIGASLSGEEVYVVAGCFAEFGTFSAVSGVQDQKFPRRRVAA